MIKHLSLLLVLSGCFFLWDQRPVWHGEGITAENAPEIHQVRNVHPFETENYKLIPVASISAETRVLARNRYWFDDFAGLSPFDYVLGWDQMSDEENLRRMQVRISERSHNIRYSVEIVPRNDISNMVLHGHFIPSTPEIMSEMRKIRRGHLISINGYIVQPMIKSQAAADNTTVNKRYQPSGQYFVWIEEISIL